MDNLPEILQLTSKFVEYHENILNHEVVGVIYINTKFEEKVKPYLEEHHTFMGYKVIFEDVTSTVQIKSNGNKPLPKRKIYYNGRMEYIL